MDENFANNYSDQNRNEKHNSFSTFLFLDFSLELTNLFGQFVNILAEFIGFFSRIVDFLFRRHGFPVNKCTTKLGSLLVFTAGGNFVEPPRAALVNVNVGRFRRLPEIAVEPENPINTADHLAVDIRHVDGHFAPIPDSIVFGVTRIPLIVHHELTIVEDELIDLLETMRTGCKLKQIHLFGSCG